MAETDIAGVLEKVEGYKDEMVQTLMELIKIPAITPKEGGEGEKKKAEVLESILKEQFRFDEIQHHDVKDEWGVLRPNIVAITKGDSSEKRLWVISHMDVVPEGNLDDWTECRPFEPVVKGNRIYGRGSEDNGQELIASLYAMKALHDLGIKPRYDTYLAFVADEEVGSTYGITHLINEGLFKDTDLIVVPDGGNSKGTLIEVSEKSIAWIKVTTEGVQAHASMPHKGKNAHRAAMRYGTKVIDFLYEKYNLRDELFDPPISTFEPTKKESNVPNINTIPAIDVFYIDCRILPQYEPEDVIRDMETLARGVEEEYGVKISIEKVMYDKAAPPTSPESEVVTRFLEAIRVSRPNIDPYAGGIGGGTCAAILRRAGYPAIVWATQDETAHSPNEYARIDFLVEDAKTFAAFYLV